MTEDYSDSEGLDLSRVLPAVYDELRRVARRYVARERAGQTLQATALVHEAYLKLANEKEHAWRNRAHFCGIAAHAMREILVEKARARAAHKRGGGCIRVSFADAVGAAEETSIDMLALNESLDRLSEFDPQLAGIVELRYFGGLTVEETAEVMKSSPATIKRGWSMAKSWLRREMEKSNEA